ncbi:Uncharacterized protein HZ326_14489 [Fusarium oxysporum f. sp. albedinis]|nr:Uncharacterized protein HZ326_14489 [Fusarium oxysporum f. sp. albedinis]
MGIRITREAARTHISHFSWSSDNEIDLQGCKCRVPYAHNSNVINKKDVALGTFLTRNDSGCYPGLHRKSPSWRFLDRQTSNADGSNCLMNSHMNTQDLI